MASNPYVEIRNGFQFLECAVRQKDSLSRCSFPNHLGSGRAESSLRDYVFCLMLVSAIAQLEHDIEQLTDVPGLGKANKLAIKLRILRNHFHISAEAFEALDRLREARNDFVHSGRFNLDAGCTKSEIPGIMVTFLQRCSHPGYL